MQLHWSIGAAGMGLCLSLLTSGAARAASFTFTKIADTSNTFSRLSDSPSINDAGTVVFSASLDAGGRGIFTGTGGAITPIALSNAANGGNPVISGLYGNPSINNAGTVAFSASTTKKNASTIFTASGTGEQLTTISDVAYGDPVINDAGTVAFTSFFPPPLGTISDRPSILVSNDGTVTAVVPGNLAQEGVSSLAINNTGIIAFSEGFSAYLGSPSAGVSTVDSKGGPITRVAKGGIYGNGPVSINGSGTVAGRGIGAAGGTQIFTVSSGGPLTTVVYGQASFNSTNFFYRVDTPSINDKGMVAFSAVIRGGYDQGILIGSNPETDLVIASGDSLFGSTVATSTSSDTNIGFSTRGLNNRGQIAFYAKFVDGTSGIFRADPITIPESSFSVLNAFWLSALGAGAMLKRYRKEVG